MSVARGALLGLIVALGLIVPRGSGSSCNPTCSWSPWNGWNPCSSTCGGGTRSRTRPLCCPRGMNAVQCIGHCSVSRSDAKQTDSCNQICYNSGAYTSGRCRCPSGFYGSCCKSRAYCGDPGTPSNGRKIGSAYYHANSVTYVCNNNYNMTGGNSHRTCRQVSPDSATTSWTGRKPTCVFAKTCLSNPCQNGGSCIDGLNQYRCACAHGWSGTHCEFDILPPAVNNCPTNNTHFTADRTEKVTWQMPKFSVLKGRGELHLTSNYKVNHAVLPWGDYFVHYTATKIQNGLRTECLAAVSVLPNPCTPLVTPTNGAVACNGWNSRYGQVCVAFCQVGKEFPLGEQAAEVYACGASGSWSKQVFSECEDAFPVSTADEHHFVGKCSDTSTRETIASSYLRQLTTSSFKTLCLASKWKAQCITDNVDIFCG